MNENFQNLSNVLRQWWEELEHRTGDRAQLRRCHSPDDVVMTSAYAEVCHRMQKEKIYYKHDLLAPVVGLLSHVKIQDEQNIPKACSAINGNQPIVSELRFQRLLQHGSSKDMFTPLIRVIRHLKGKVGLQSLINDVYFWGDKTRRRWAEDYFDTAPKK